jgi:hypothetical protein
MACGTPFGETFGVERMQRIYFITVVALKHTVLVLCLV